jgi:hypothetical protein
MTNVFGVELDSDIINLGECSFCFLDDEVQPNNPSLEVRDPRGREKGKSCVAVPFLAI